MSHITSFKCNEHWTVNRSVIFLFFPSLTLHM